MTQVSWRQLKWDQGRVKWNMSDTESITCWWTFSFVYNVTVKQTLPTINWSTVDWSKLRLGNFEDDMQALIEQIQKLELSDDEKKQD